MTSHHLAQLNIADLAAPIDSPQLAGFVALLPEINELAERSPGYVWRLTDDTGADATSLRPFGPETIVNLTVWESVDALREFTYRSAHLAVVQRRREWFRPSGRAYQVLWWVEAGRRPTLAEAARRLATLEENGPTPEAFTFRQPFPPPGGDALAPPEIDAEFCDRP
jgi:hypothetical protein